MNAQPNDTLTHPNLRNHAMLSLPIETTGASWRGAADPALLSDYLHGLARQRTLILLVTLLCASAALLYASLASPVFEANMLIHVEQDTPGATGNMLTDMSSLFDRKSAPSAEMELLRSRLVVGRVVDQLRLDVQIEPLRLPLLGNWIARGAHGRFLEPGLFGFGGFAWGSEQAELAEFNVPDSLVDVPLGLTVLSGKRYRLRGGAVALDGVIGVAATQSLADGELKVRITDLQARPGTEFVLRRLARQPVVEHLQKALQVAEQGKFSGVIQVSLEGDDPIQVSQVLAAVGRTYLDQHVARKTEEAEKSLAFLDSQLPALKSRLEQAEQKYSQFRNRAGSIDLAEEARISLQRSAAAKNRRDELVQKRVDLLARFTAEHPLVQALDHQLAIIDADLVHESGYIRSLPQDEQTQARMLRDIKQDAELYTALTNSAQQLRLAAVDKASNVRLIDAPIAPEQPIRPRRAVTVALATLTGFACALLLALGRNAVRRSITRPEQIERLFGAPVVYATIPHSRLQAKLSRKGGCCKVLAAHNTKDAAVESLRGLRAALQFSLPHFRNNIVVLGGVTPGLGKAFVAANFAAVMAAGCKKVLLIDADLNKGHLHDYFGLAPENGLADAISGAATLAQVIHLGVCERLDFIAAGNCAPGDIELLIHLNFGELLDVVGAQYDLVLIAAPAILASADALTIGAHAGAVFIVARAEVSTEEQLRESIKRLNKAGISPQGIVFNDVLQDKIERTARDAGTGRMNYQAQRYVSR